MWLDLSGSERKKKKMKNQNEEALEALSRVINLGEFNLMKYAPNGSWRNGFKKDAETIRAALQAQAAPVDVEEDIAWVKNRMQSTRDKLNTAIQEIIDVEVKIKQTNITKKGDEG